MVVVVMGVIVMMMMMVVVGMTVGVMWWWGGVWLVEVMAVEVAVCMGVTLVKRVVRVVRGDGDGGGGGERELFMRFKSFFVTQVLSSSNLLGASWCCTVGP